jgi:hypothetical protein
MARGPRDSWFDHWREYLAEAVGLGLLLLGVGSVATLLHYPGSLLWIYFTAPPLGMLLAAELYRRWLSHGRPQICAKLDHTDRYHCIFKCGYRAGMRPM